MLNKEIGFSGSFAALFFALLISGCSQKEVSKPDLSAIKGNPDNFCNYISNVIIFEMAKESITGLAVAVVDDRETIYQAGFGYADTAIKAPVTSDSIFELCSISKLFTATAVMQLYEKGLIDLDKPITTYLREFSIRMRTASESVPTVRMLLCHHSGIPSDRAGGAFIGTNYNVEYTGEFKKIASLFSNETMAYPPNKVFSYGNLGYSLLGDIVERTSGMDFEKYVQKNILIPLGMKDSSFVFRDDFKTRYIKGYLEGKETIIPVIRDIPAGGLKAPIADMARFLKMVIAGGSLDGETLLKTETMHEMLKIQNRNVPLDGSFKIGLGYWNYSFPQMHDEVVYGHDGDLPPFHSLILFMPERKIGLVVMINSIHGAMGSSLDLFPIAIKTLSALIEMKTGKPYDTIPAESPRRDFTAGEISNLPGYYAGWLGFSRIKINGSGLQAEISGTDLDLSAHQDGTISEQYKLFGFIPLKIEFLDLMSLEPFEFEGNPCFMVKLYGIPFATDIKVKPAPVPESWVKAAGTYISTEAMPYASESENRINLVYDKKTGFYFCKVWVFDGPANAIDYPLEILNDHEAVFMGYGRHLGETLRIERSGSNYILYGSGMILNKLNNNN